MILCFYRCLYQGSTPSLPGISKWLPHVSQGTNAECHSLGGSYVAPMEFLTCCLGSPSVFFFLLVLIMMFFLLSWLVRERSQWEAESTCLHLNVITRRLAHASWGQYALEMPAAQWWAPQCFRRSRQATEVHPKAPDLQTSLPPWLPLNLGMGMVRKPGN